MASLFEKPSVLLEYTLALLRVRSNKTSDNIKYFNHLKQNIDTIITFSRLISNRNLYFFKKNFLYIIKVGVQLAKKA